MAVRRNENAGLTLVELLVVVVIMVMLVAVVLPLAQPSPQSRLVREALAASEYLYLRGAVASDFDRPSAWRHIVVGPG